VSNDIADGPFMETILGVDRGIAIDVAMRLIANNR